MANSRDFTGKNRKFTGTKGIVTPKGTTGERVGSESGELRFNTTTELMEYFDGTTWKPIDAPPTITTVTTNDSVGTNTVLNADGSTLFTITINGGNFSTNPTVKFIGNTGTEYTAGNINRVSASQITCTTLSNMGTTDDPYDVRVSNISGLSATLDDAFSYNVPPVFVNASSVIGSVWNGRVVSGSSIDASATDAEGNTITYSIVSGSLPGSGLTLSSSTGYITGTVSGTPSLGNYSFVVRAATTEGTVERQFSIQVIANTYNVDVLMVGGGGGGTNYSGGAGSGEVIYITSRSVTRGSEYTLTIGGGGPGQYTYSVLGVNGKGTSTTGFSETVKPGGGAHGADGTLTPSAQVGVGEGGSSRQGPVTGQQGTSVGTGVTRYGGYSGGQGSCGAPRYPGAGGGGSNGNGSPATPNTSPGGNGGPGISINITGTAYNWGGGGGGACYTVGPGGNGGAGGGGGAGAQDGGTGGTGGAGLNPGQNGIGPGAPYRGGAAGANTGGGGGSGPQNIQEDPSSPGGNGGSGIVIVRYDQNSAPSITATGGTTSTYVSGTSSYKVHTFLTSGSFTA